MHFLRRSAVAHVYQRVCAMFFANTFWRRKWPVLIALISCVILTLTLLRVSIVPGEASTPKRDTYLDDVPEDLYQEGESALVGIHLFLKHDVSRVTRRRI